MDKDPEMARSLKPNDRQRIVRALEVLAATGQSLADWQRMPGVPVIAPERDGQIRFVAGARRALSRAAMRASIR